MAIEDIERQEREKKRAADQLRQKHEARGNGEAEFEDDASQETFQFPEVAWRGIFADYRKAMRGTSEAPDSAHFAALWSTVGARLHRRVSFFYAYPHFANTYIVVYGPTGDSKTSAMRAALKTLPDDGSVRILRGLGSAEALGDWMQAGEGRGSHLLYVEEVGSVLSRGGWEGSTLLHFLTETFDAPDSYEIPFRKNPVRVTEPTPSLLAGTTSEWFWSAARERDFHGGFGNRLFFMTGAPKEPISLPCKPDPMGLARVKLALGELGNIGRCELALTPDAQALWGQFYTAWKKTGPLLDSLTAAATKRTHTYAIKLALAYAALERTIPDITAPQIVAAIEVANFGFLCTKALVRGRQEFSVQGRCERAILATLNIESLPAWKLHHRIGGGRFTAQDLDRALKALLATGAVVATGKTNRERPSIGREGGI